jgi:hypothetical protein
MNNEEKIQIINEKIYNLSCIIDNLSYGISNIPWEESKGIDTRQSDLNDYMLKKQAFLNELSQIEDSGII